MDNNTNARSDATHLLNSNQRSVVGNIRIDRANFQQRTVERSRVFREHLHRFMEEMRPLFEQPRTVHPNDMSVTNLLYRQPSREDGSSSSSERDSFIINLGETPQSSQPESNLIQHVHTTDNFLNNMREATTSLEQAAGNSSNNNNNNNNTDEPTATQGLRQIPAEARVFLHLLQKYVPFVLILFAKALYDHREGIFNFLSLIGCFCHANSIVISEAAKQAKRSLTSLFIESVYILGCLLIITYVFFEEKLLTNLILIPPYRQALSVWDLLWIVGITDYILRLITILIKICIILIPACVIPYQKRGKIYLFVEATSQLYRSLAPFQPWLYYLLESYQGAEKVTGVFLSAAYMIFKTRDLMSRLMFFKTASFKLLLNVSLGSSPTIEQLQSAGSQCPICHDEYDNPVLLQCRHIFCEECVSTWFDREQTCPLCRAKVVDDPSWRDGSTTHFTQLF